MKLDETRFGIWKPDIDREAAEQRVSWLERQIIAAERAIAAQRRLIDHDGNLIGYQLSLKDLTREVQMLESDLAEIMRLRKSEALDFALAGRKYEEHRAPAGVLAAFLFAMQALFTRIGQSLTSTRITPVVPPGIANICQLEVAEFFPSSFGVRFLAETRSDLTGHSLTTTALEATFDLITAEQPLDQAAKLGPYALAKYRGLVGALLKAEATPKVYWRAPSGSERAWIIDSNELLNLANRLSHIKGLEPRLRQLTGVLTGASLRRRRFEFNAEGQTVTGIAPRELADSVTAYFGKRCTIVFTEVIYIDETTDQERRTRTLIKIKP